MFKHLYERDFKSTKELQEKANNLVDEGYIVLVWGNSSIAPIYIIGKNRSLTDDYR